MSLFVAHYQMGSLYSCTVWVDSKGIDRLLETLRYSGEKLLNPAYDVHKVG